MNRPRAGKLRKIIDETAEVRCTVGSGVIREEVWQSAGGEIVRYNLAFINHSLFAKDNGRVLGYDNKHGSNHRHHAGKTTRFTFTTYEELMTRFLDEVRALRERVEPL